jgi:hypothetical protein
MLFHLKLNSIRKNSSSYERLRNIKINLQRLYCFKYLGSIWAGINRLITINEDGDQCCMKTEEELGNIL